MSSINLLQPSDRDVSDGFSGQGNLEEQLLKFSVVVEQTPAMVMITGTDGTIEYINPAFTHITGYKPEEILGKNPRILKSGLMPVELFRQMWATISSGQVWHGELCNKKKNGDLYWDLGTVSPIRNKDGVITNYISVKEEITVRKKNEEELNQYRQSLEKLVEERTAELRDEIEERKRAEEILKENEQRLAEAQRIGKLGSWEWNIQTGEMIWSDESYRIFGVEPSTFNPTYQKALDMVHPDDREAVQNAIDMTLSTGKPLNIDHTIIPADGQPRVITLHVVPVYKDQDIVKLAGTIQDISERVHIHKELLEKERMSNELEIARGIQFSLLPKTCPAVEGWQFAAHYRPARQVGGDFYDFIPLPQDRIGLVMADVVDKGVPAALMMSLSRAIIRTIAMNGFEPSETLSRSNDILYHDYAESAFTTVFLAWLDPQSGQMIFANGGHNRPYLFSSTLNEINELSSKGMVLGLMPGIFIEQKTIQINDGDVLILYTDGLTEARNQQDAFYGEERLATCLRTNTNKNADEILETVLQSWEQFLNASTQQDDISIIVVKRTGLSQKL